MFMTNVMTKSVRPTAKIVLYSIEPVGDVADAGRADECGHRLGLLARIEGDLGDPAGGDEDDHRLTDCPRDREDEARNDSRDRGRDDDPGRDLEARGPERVGAVAELLRHGRHGVLGDGCHDWDEQDPDRESGREDVEHADVEAEVLEVGRQERQGEESEDDRRDPGERLERRLDDVADARTRILAHVDRGSEPTGQADDTRPEGHDESSHEERLDAVRRGRRRAAPSGRPRRSRGWRPR